MMFGRSFLGKIINRRSLTAYELWGLADPLVRTCLGFGNPLVETYLGVTEPLVETHVGITKPLMDKYESAGWKTFILVEKRLRLIVLRLCLIVLHSSE